MMKRFVCVFLFLLLMADAPFIGVPVYAAQEDSQLTVLYIPLDDRTQNDHQARLMAEGMGINLMMPERDLYATKLDGGETNSNGTQVGDRGALLEYLKENADLADIFILSMDQLLSGGLMNSRCMEEFSAIVLSDGTEMTEYDMIDYISELAKTKPVYIIDSIQRLATSNEFGGYDLADYTLSRRYGKVARPVLVDSELTLENVIANYNRSINGMYAYLRAGFSVKELAYFLGKADFVETPEISEDMEIHSIKDQDYIGDIFEGAEQIIASSSLELGEEEKAGEEYDDSLLARYLRIRQRKITLLDYSLRTLSGTQNVYYLLGVDDSAAGNSIHLNEIAYAQSLMHPNDQIFSAVDGMFQTALTQAYRNYCGRDQIRFGVTYYGDNKENVGTFNYQTNAQMVEKLISYHNGVLVAENPDISVLVYTTSDDQTERNRNMLELISQVNQNEADHVPTILVDFAGTESASLKELYLDGIHMGMLLSYSGEADGVVRVNMAISQGVGRYLYLSETDEPSQDTQERFIESLLWSFVNEYYYTKGGKNDMQTYLAGRGHGSYFGEVDSEELMDIHDSLTETVKHYAEGVLANFISSNYISSLKPFKLGAVSAARISSCWFPWLRQFEIGGEVQCKLLETAGETVLHSLYCNGITKEQFCPNEPLTREQATKMLDMISGTEPMEKTDCEFEDVANWAKPYVAAAEKAGYIKGYPDGTFRGGEEISRAEFSQMLVQYMQVEGITLEKQDCVSFTDVDRNGKRWYTDAVYLLADGGILHGYKDGTFLPENQITRAEAVTMLGRLFKREEELGDGIMQISRYTDVSTKFWAYKAIQEASLTHFLN